MNLAAWAAACLVLTTLSVGTAQKTAAQGIHPPVIVEGDSVIAAFVRQARAATRKYHSVDAAIAAGYRLIGPDFPGMGEHWVHVRLAIQRKFDRARPNVLTYLQVEGERILTGVAFAIPVLPGGSPPDFPFPEAWHYHSGTIDEEALILNPHAMDHGDAEEARLAMVHAWVWTENPGGLFEQDNWALPFLRLGLLVPDEIPPQAGKALFLLTGGVEYYAQLVQLAGEPDPEDKAAVREILSKYHELVRAAVELAMSERAHPVQTPELSHLWHALWAEIQQRVSKRLWTRIRMLAG